MRTDINPFNELYVTETTPPEHFIKLFSPFLIKHALPLFQPGNVVLKGVQGSGKSMLLNLFKPEIRIAYKKAGMEFPIPKGYRKFIGAGINLTRSGAINFGQRQIESEEKRDLEILPLYFGDFLNYWIILDLLNSIEKYVNDLNGEIAKELGISSNEILYDKFAISLSRNPCWFGYLSEVKNYVELKTRIQGRIASYRSFLNFNIQSLPEEIKTSKTTIGGPISAAVEELWENLVVARDIAIFIKIDQYEELCGLEDWNKDLGPKYRQIVNKALGTRDPRLSYRIGARRYAWQENLQIFATESKIERERDYKIVDLDELSRRKENNKTWIFPSFAEDVFERRINYSGIEDQSQGSQRRLLEQVLGKGLSNEAKAKIYGGSSPTRALRKEPEWPEKWCEFFIELAESDLLSAKLGEAWLRQNIKKAPSRPSHKKPFQWDKKPYWKKERIQQALIQIAARCGQRPIWSGKDDVLALSGSNILVFVSLCQHIWGAWVRSVKGNEDALDSKSSLSKIEDSVQNIGIQVASSYWVQKIPEQSGGNARQRFIDVLGRYFQDQLQDDFSMSYPGSNGFSLRVDDFENAGDASKFLKDAVDFGDLIEVAHTTKNKDRRQRIKWYLNSILSPYYRIPVVRAKEPIYTDADLLEKWFIEAGIKIKFGPASKVKHSIPKSIDRQMSLFDGKGK